MIGTSGLGSWNGHWSIMIYWSVHWYFSNDQFSPSIDQKRVDALSHPKFQPYHALKCERWCWYIYLQNWVIYGANVGKIFRTWSIWDGPIHIFVISHGSHGEKSWADKDLQNDKVSMGDSMEDIIHWDQNPVSVTFRFTVLGVGDISINFDCSTETLKDTKPDL